MFSRRLQSSDLERYQYLLLVINEHDEALSQKGLCSLLHIDKSYMCSILDYLEEKGYTYRQKNPNDRREQLIRLTDKAKQEIPKIQETLEELNQKSFQHLSKDQINQFYNTLNIIQANLSDSEPSEYMLDFKKIQIP